MVCLSIGFGFGIRPSYCLVYSLPCFAACRMNFLLAILLSFLPPYYRRFFACESQAHIIRVAIVTAFLELVFACILYAQGFVEYIRHAVIGPAAFLEYFFPGKD